VAELAVRLQRRLPQLTTRVVDQIMRVEPAYHEVTDLSADELAASVQGSLSQFIRKLVDPGAETFGYLNFLTEVGKRRVEQGLPLESLLRAFRIGARTIWEGLREEAAAVDGDEAPDSTALVEGATAIWELHENVSARVATAYRDAELAMLRRRERERHALIDGLLEGRGKETSFARDAAFALRLRLSGRYVVVVAEAIGDGSEALPRVERALAGRGFSSAWRTGPPRTVGIVDLGDGDLRTLHTVLEQLSSGRVGVSTTVKSLGELLQAHQLAETALDSVPPRTCEVGLLCDRLPAALLAASPQISTVLVEQMLGGLFAVDADERTLLLHTVEAYIDSGSSAKDTAVRIHCHRNTVLKRLRRFEELTKRSLTDPTTLLSVALAVRAVPLLRATPGTPAE
jgi:hypothetical protein